MELRPPLMMASIWRVQENCIVHECLAFDFYGLFAKDSFVLYAKDGTVLSKGWFFLSFRVYKTVSNLNCFYLGNMLLVYKFKNVSMHTHSRLVYYLVLRKTEDRTIQCIGCLIKVLARTLLPWWLSSFSIIVIFISVRRLTFCPVECHRWIPCST